MEEHPSQPLQPEPATPIQETPVAVPRKNVTRNQVLIIVGLLLLIVCLCVGGCLALGGVGAMTAIQEREPITQVLDQFMQAMAAEDTEQAFALFSSRAQRQMGKDNLDKLLEGNNYALFEGYLRLEIGNLNLSKGVNTNPDVPQGTVAKVNGTVHYEGGFTGSFDAILEKEEGVWRLDAININVPPDKIGP
jgi:hypothetical protein